MAHKIDKSKGYEKVSAMMKAGDMPSKDYKIRRHLKRSGDPSGPAAVKRYKRAYKKTPKR